VPACPEPFDPELTAEGRSRGVPIACLPTVALREGGLPIAFFTDSFIDTTILI